jgi:hypothetical protein
VLLIKSPHPTRTGSVDDLGFRFAKKPSLGSADRRRAGALNALTGTRGQRSGPLRIHSGIGPIDASRVNVAALARWAKPGNRPAAVGASLPCYDLPITRWRGLRAIVPFPPRSLEQTLSCASALLAPALADR